MDSTIMPVAAFPVRLKTPANLKGSGHREAFKLMQNAEPIVKSCHIKCLSPLPHRPRWVCAVFHTFRVAIKCDFVGIFAGYAFQHFRKGNDLS